MKKLLSVFLLFALLIPITVIDSTAADLQPDVLCEIEALGTDSFAMAESSRAEAEVTTPFTPETTAPPAATPPKTDDSPEDKDDDVTTIGALDDKPKLLWIIIPAIIVLGGGATAFFIFKKRKNK